MEEKAILGTFEGECLDTNITNKNGLDITREVIEEVLASEDYEDGIKNGWYIGFLSHPEDVFCDAFTQGCIVLTDMWIEDSGKVYAKFNLLNTPVGRIVKTMIDAGIKFGVSIRGAGDIVANSVEPGTFIFKGYDLVAYPAYPESMPEFIAASTDPAQRKKYQAVCAAVQNNISEVTDIGALELMQAQFAPNSNERAVIAKRIQNIQTASENDLNKERIEAMVSLYVDCQAEVEAAKKALRAEKERHRQEISASKRKMSALKRITAAQMSDIQVSVDRITASNERLRGKNTTLAKQLDDVKKSNLIYKQKVEASTAKYNEALQRKDNELAEVRADLHKTVMANKSYDKRTSDLGVNNQKLRAELADCRSQLREFQEAYADIYASAVGVDFNPKQIVTASTVEEIQQMIAGATNTANIAPSVTLDELYLSDGNEDELITL